MGKGREGGRDRELKVVRQVQGLQHVEGGESLYGKVTRQPEAAQIQLEDASCIPPTLHKVRQGCSYAGPHVVNARLSACRLAADHNSSKQFCRLAAEGSKITLLVEGTSAWVMVHTKPPPQIFCKDVGWRTATTPQIESKNPPPSPPRRGANYYAVQSISSSLDHHDHGLRNRLTLSRALIAGHLAEVQPGGLGIAGIQVVDLSPPSTLELCHVIVQPGACVAAKATAVDAPPCQRTLTLCL